MDFTHIRIWFYLSNPWKNIRDFRLKWNFLVYWAYIT
jgi:hypothetical protein